MVKNFIVLFACMAIPAAAADNFETIEKQINQRSQNIQSITYTSTYFTDDESTAGKVHTEGQTKYSYVRNNSQPLYRNETTYTTISDFHGSKQSSKGTTLTICDGQYLYMLNEFNGSKTATKQPTTKINQNDQWQFLTTLKQTYNLKVLPDDKINGRSAWVIRATPKQAITGMPAEQLVYLDKQTGIAIKTVSRNASGKVIMESSTKNLTINSTIQEEQFVFTPPAGIKVTELGGGYNSTYNSGN